MIPMSVLDVRLTLLIGDSNRATARMNNERADYDCGVGTRLSPVSVSFNVLMTLVIGRVHRWHETNCVRWWAVV